MLAGLLIALVVGAEPVQSDRDDGGTLLVRVTAEGRPVDGAAVSTRCAADPTPVLTVGGQATLRRIRGNHCWVNVEKSGFVSDDFLFSMSSGSGEAELRLFPRVDLTVIARTQDGGVLDGIEVHLSGDHPGGFVRSGRPTAVPAGAFLFAAWAEGHERTIVHHELTPGTQTVEIVLPVKPPPPVVLITGRLIDVAGRPVSSAWLAGWVGSKKYVAEFDAEGRFELDVHEAGPVSLRGQNDDVGSLQQIIEAPAKDVVLTLDPRGVVEPRFVADVPPKAIRFELEPLSKEQRGVWWGTRRVAGLPGGRYRLTVKEVGWAPVDQELEISEREVNRPVIELKRVEIPSPPPEQPGLHQLYLIR